MFEILDDDTTGMGITNKDIEGGHSIATIISTTWEIHPRSRPAQISSVGPGFKEYS